MRTMLVLGVALVIGCEAAPTYRRPDCPPKWGMAREAYYEVHPTETTPKGIEVDGARADVVERLTDEVEACLLALNPALTPEEQRAGGCQAPTFDGHVCRRCLVAKVAPDWFWVDSTKSPGYTRQQVLPIIAGEQPNGKPLYWRVFIQDDWTIVTPPSLYIYKEGVVRVTTGCFLPWSVPRIAACMNPTTRPDEE